MRTGTVAFLFGVVIFQHLPLLPGVHWAPAFLVLPLLYRYRRSWAFRALCWGAAGFLWSWLYAAALLADPLPSALEGVDLAVEGHVVGLPRVSGRRVRFELEPRRLRHGGHEIPAPGRLRLTWYGAPHDLAAGQYWQLTVRLKRPRGLLNPGAFDYEAWLFRNGVRATGYVRKRPPPRHLAELDRGAVDAWRRRVSDALAQELRASPVAGLIRALTVGDRAGIDERQWQALTATGTNHLMAISGLHVGMVAGLTAWLGAWGWRRCARCCLWLPAPRAAVAAGLAAAFLYALLAGLSLPTQRAVVMLAVVAGGLWWYRPLPPGRTLALALLAVLLLDPVAVLSPGFWLSFGAVALILYGLGGRLRPRGPWWRFGRVQWLVAVGLAPVLALFFQQASLSAPLVNVVAVPWVGVVVALALIGLAAWPLWPWLGAGLLQLAAATLEVLWRGIEMVADGLDAPFLTVPTAPVMLAALFGVAWLLAPRGWPARWLGGVCLLPLLLATPPRPPPGSVEVTVLDVGQGLAVVARTARHVLLYDTGPRFSAAFDAGSAVVVPYLRHLGYSHADVAMVSHSDNDHAGGLAAIRDEVAIARLLSGQPGSIAGAAGCERGQGWHWDGVDFDVLWPPPGAGPASDNDRSCVLRIGTSAGAVLLTGDVEVAAERRLLELEPALAASVLVAPHHGSATSSSSAFLARLAPRWVLVSNGYGDMDRFPDPEVKARYHALGAQVLETARSGPLTVRLGADGVAVAGWRERHRRYWQDAAGAL